MRWLFRLAVRAVHRRRRWLFLVKIRLLARINGGRVTIDVAPDLVVGRDVELRFDRSPTVHVTIGPGVRIGAGTVLWLQRGRLTIGRDVEIRRGCVVSVGGDLVIGDGSIISFDSKLFCNELLHLDRWCGIAHDVTVVDSYHVFVDPDRYFFSYPTEGRPVRVGENTWIAAGAIVTAGVTVGDHCVVGAGAVVNRDVPSWHMAVGSPATVRPISPTLLATDVVRRAAASARPHVPAEGDDHRAGDELADDAEGL